MSATAETSAGIATRAGSYVRLALPRPRLTTRLETPGSSPSALSTWATHEAQLMPWIGKLIDRVFVVIHIPFDRTAARARRGVRTMPAHRLLLVRGLPHQDWTAQ